MAFSRRKESIMRDAASFRLTYSTMFDPPAQLHANFDAALGRVRAALGATHTMWVDGSPRASSSVFEVFSPVDRRVLLGRFAHGTREDVDSAVRAARRAFPAWRALGWAERVRLLRRVAALIEERVYDIAAAVALEVARTAWRRWRGAGDGRPFRLVRRADGSESRLREGLPDDPLPGFTSRNRTLLKPYGVWAVIAPFNFPFALAVGRSERRWSRVTRLCSSSE